MKQRTGEFTFFLCATLLQRRQAAAHASFKKAYMPDAGKADSVKTENGSGHP